MFVASIFRKSDGVILRSCSVHSPEIAALQCQEGEGWIKGTADSNKKSVANGKFIDRVFTTEEAAAYKAQLLEELRTIRNRLLADCDWTQLPDVVITAADKTKWQNYRQALRDMPGDIGDQLDALENPKWPVSPLKEVK